MMSGHGPVIGGWTQVVFLPGQHWVPLSVVSQGGGRDDGCFCGWEKGYARMDHSYADRRDRGG